VLGIDNPGSVTWRPVPRTETSGRFRDELGERGKHGQTP